MTPKFLQTYADEVSEHLDFLPTWPFDYDVRLGDVGVFQGGVFKRTDTLDTLGIHGSAIRRGKGAKLLEFSSRSGVEFVSGAGAKSALEGLGADLEIRFNRDGAVFLRVGEHIVEQFESTDTLGREIIQRYERGDWQRNRVIVTEVVKASAATVLVSGSGGASATFKIDASVPVTEALAMGKLSQLVSATGSFTTKIVGEKVSPLLRTCGLRGLFQKDFRTQTVGMTPPLASDLMFVRVDSSRQLED